MIDCGPYDGFDSMIKLGSLAVTANLFHVFEPLVNLIESTVHVLRKQVHSLLQTTHSVVQDFSRFTILFSMLSTLFSRRSNYWPWLFSRSCLSNQFQRWNVRGTQTWSYNFGLTLTSCLMNAMSVQLLSALRNATFKIVAVLASWMSVSCWESSVFTSSTRFV